MSEERKPKVAKSDKERIVAIEAKIAFHQGHIDILNEKKEALLNPKPKLTTRLVIEKAKEAGMSPEQIAKKLGISL